MREAFAGVPRHLFVPNVDVESVYSDQPVFIRWDGGVTISSFTQPTMTAIMAEQLRVEPGSRVLEIGAGTGYGDVEAVRGDGFVGYSPGESYDRIMVTVGLQDVSPHWVEPLRDGGIMVIPLWFRGYRISVALQKRGGVLESLSASPCMFISIRGIAGRTEGYFPVGDAARDSPQLFVRMERDEPDHRRNLAQIFVQDVRFRETGRSLQGQFHTQDLSSSLYMFLTRDSRINTIHWETPDGRFQGAGYAPVDLEMRNSAVPADGHPDRAMVYGVYGGDATYLNLIRLLDRWISWAAHRSTISASALSPSPHPYRKTVGYSQRDQPILGSCPGTAETSFTAQRANPLKSESIPEQQVRHARGLIAA